MTELQGLIDFSAKLNVVFNKPRLPLWKNSSKETREMEDLCRAYDELSSNLEFSGEPKYFQIKPYSGENEHVLSMMHQLSHGKGSHIHQVILQGSLATNEEIGYSDFDALVVLEEEAFSNVDRLKESISSLWNLYKEIIKQDILQHHGWFVTTRKLLKHHLEDFFPAVIFEHSVLIYPASEASINLNLVKNPSSFLYHLTNTLNGIEREISSGQYLKNMYELKSTLSKFMLLPALYMQVKRGHGVYKKDSFGLVKQEFTEQEWAVMDYVSLLRKDWIKPDSKILALLALTLPSASRILAKRFAPSVSNNMRNNLQNKRIEILKFLRLMQVKVETYI
ncbi:hypothetical protein ACFLR1_01085 [Bacteroidota bacterium]